MRQVWFVIASICYSSVSYGLTFRIQANSDIVGGLQTAIVQPNESLADIGRRFDIGIYEMMEANPKVAPWNPRVGRKVIIPARFILPSGQRKGIVINLAEMRLYYFHPNNKIVITHPIGIGRRGAATPLTTAKIIEKRKHPSWRPPVSIRRAHARKGHILPQVVPPGPNNPLGDYAMRLSLESYLIHGTNRKGGVGVRSSSGCIRMFPEDIESLFYQVDIGTPVRITHEPYKLGKHRGQTYLEIHEPLSDKTYQGVDSMKKLTEIFANLNKASFAQNWHGLEKIFTSFKGSPVLLQELLDFIEKNVRKIEE